MTATRKPGPPPGLDQVIYQSTKERSPVNGQVGFQPVGSSLDDDSHWDWDARLHPRAGAEQPSLCYLRYANQSAALIFRTPVQGPTRGQFFAHALIGTDDKLTPERALASLDWDWQGALRPGAKVGDRNDLGQADPQVYGAWADKHWKELSKELTKKLGTTPEGGAWNDAGDRRKFVIFIDRTPEDLPVLLLAGLVTRAGSVAVIGDGFATHEPEYIGEKSLPRFVFAWRPQSSLQALDRTPVDLRRTSFEEAVRLLVAEVCPRETVPTAASPVLTPPPPVPAGAVTEDVPDAGNVPADTTQDDGVERAPLTNDAARDSDQAAPDATADAETAAGVDQDPVAADVGADDRTAVEDDHHTPAGDDDSTAAEDDNQASARDDHHTALEDGDGTAADTRTSSTAQPLRAAEDQSSWDNPATGTAGPADANDDLARGSQRDMNSLSGSGLDDAQHGYQGGHSGSRPPDRAGADGPSRGDGDGQADFYSRREQPPPRGDYRPGPPWENPAEVDERVAREVAPLTDAALIRYLVSLDDRLDDMPAFTKQLRVRAARRQAAAEAAAQSRRQATTASDPVNPAVAGESLFAAYRGRMMPLLAQQARTEHYEWQLADMFSALAHLLTADTPPGAIQESAEIDYAVAVTQEHFDPVLRREIAARVWAETAGKVPWHTATAAGPHILAAHGIEVAPRPRPEDRAILPVADKQRLRLVLVSITLAFVTLMLACVVILLIGGIA